MVKVCEQQPLVTFLVFHVLLTFLCPNDASEIDLATGLGLPGRIDEI